MSETLRVVAVLGGVVLVVTMLGDAVTTLIVTQGYGGWRPARLYYASRGGSPGRWPPTRQVQPVRPSSTCTRDCPCSDCSDCSSCGWPG